MSEMHSLILYNQTAPPSLLELLSLFWLNMFLSSINTLWSKIDFIKKSYFLVPDTCCLIGKSLYDIIKHSKNIFNPTTMYKWLRVIFILVLVFKILFSSNLVIIHFFVFFLFLLPQYCISILTKSNLCMVFLWFEKLV